MSHALSCGDLFSSNAENQPAEWRHARFLAMSPSDDSAEDPNKRSIISYSKDFLLSLAKTESIALSKDVRLSDSLGFEVGLLSPPFSDSDSRLDTSVPQLPPLKVTDKNNDSLHKSNIPYRPPHRYKELYESSGFPNSTSLQKGGEKRWKHVSASHEEKSYVDKAPLSQEDKKLVNKDKDCHKSSESFLLSPSSGNFSILQSSSEATGQMDAPHKSCLIQEAVDCNALQPTMVPRIAKSCSDEHQPLQEAGFHLKESEACSNLNVGHPDRIPGVMELLDKSISPIFNKKLFEFGKGAKLEDLVSPPVEDNKPFLSMDDKSAMVHCKGNFFLDGVDQAISLGRQQNSSTCACQILQDLDLNTYSKLEENSNYSPDLCLPDEDSLIRFDEPFLKPGDQCWDAVDEFPSSPEKNPIIDGKHTPNSPGEMIVKLVEAVLDDESYPAPYLVDPVVYHNSGLPAQQSHAPFCHNQLSPGWDQQVHNTVQRNSIDSTTYSSLAHRYFPSNTISQPFHLFHDKMRQFDHTGAPMFQQMKNLDPPYPSSFRGSLGGVIPNLSKHQMGSHAHC